MNGLIIENLRRKRILDSIDIIYMLETFGMIEEHRIQEKPLLYNNLIDAQIQMNYEFEIMTRRYPQWAKHKGYVVAFVYEPMNYFNNNINWRITKAKINK